MLHSNSTKYKANVCPGPQSREYETLLKYTLIVNIFKFNVFHSTFIGFAQKHSASINEAMCSFWHALAFGGLSSKINDIEDNHLKSRVGQLLAYT